MYLHKEYNTRAVPRYLPVYNEVQYLDEQIDAIAKQKYFARKRLDKQYQRASQGFSRIIKQSQELNQKIRSDKKTRQNEQSNFKKDLDTTAQTMADINDYHWRQSRIRKEVEEIREFNSDVRLRDRLVESNIKAFDRLHIMRTRQ